MIGRNTTQTMFIMLTALAAPIFVSAQGSLTLSGPPAPTMKSLDEIYTKANEAATNAAAASTAAAAAQTSADAAAAGVANVGDPRTPIRAADLPYNISAAGSFYLAEPIAWAVQNAVAITINASNVTLDLNGFNLVGPGKTAGATGSAVDAGTAGLFNITVRNGNISGFRNYGVDLNDAIGSRAQDLSVSSCGSYGISMGQGCVVVNCSAYLNGVGIRSDGASTLANCSVYDSDSEGFQIFSDNAAATLANCISRGNGRDGFSFADGVTAVGCNASGNSWSGFWFDDGCTLNACTSTGNGVVGSSYGSGFEGGNDNNIVDCASTKNFYYGITVAADNILRDNICNANDRDGIYLNDPDTYGAANNNQVIGNTCNYNGKNSAPYHSFSAAGIYVEGTDNRIEGNHFFNNDLGVDVQPITGNFIVRNTAGRNTGTGEPSANYDFNNEYQHFGEIQTFSPGIFDNVQFWANWQLYED